MKNEFKVQMLKDITMKRFILIRGLKRSKNGINWEIISENEIDADTPEVVLQRKVAEMALTEGVEMVSLMTDNYRVVLSELDEGYQE